MGRPRRDIRATAEASTTPPDELTPSQHIARVIKAEGDGRYSCMLPSQDTVLVELAARFRNTIWVKRGGYVLVDLIPAHEKKGKLDGDIVNVIREEKEWRKQSYWPKEFRNAFPNQVDDDNEEYYEGSTVGKLPPSDSEDEEE